MAAAFDFKTVLDQYNRQPGDFRDTAQKVIAGLTVYAGLHAAVFFFVAVLGTANYLRLARSHSAVIEALAPDSPATMRKLGILQREPFGVALAWGGLYVFLHGGFLIVAHLVDWAN